MPTTSNFGWTTPADTDLVKDGAAAIRTLGNGIDTSFLDLKGGTSGQVLSKNSNTDLDYTWVTPNVGDITEVQAGVGISVASGTGPIPIITNSSTDLITTAGDLLYGTAADTVARLGIGTANQVLAVNSGATAPEWKTVASGGMTSIASGNLSTSSSTLSLTSISTDYNDLRLVIRDIRPTNNDKSLGIQVNSVSDNDFFYYNSSGVGAVYGNATVNAIAGGMANSNDENYLIVDFLDYANTDSAKCIESVLKYNEAGGQAGKIAKVSGAANTTSAITSISIIMSGSDNFGLAGSYVLYGVK
jgi:hypothetical protein